MKRARNQAGTPTPMSKDEVRRLRDALGQRIASERRRHNPPWTQFDLAMASGCRPEAISRIERGTVDFGVGKLFRIARALGVDAGVLLGAVGKTNPR